MKKSILSLMLSTAFISVGQAKVDTNGVYMINLGIPLLFPSNCSAFTINHPNRDKPVAVTAHHCTTRLGSKPETFKTALSANGSLMGFSDSIITSPYAMGVTTDKEAIKTLDTYMAVVEEEVDEDVKVYEIASKLPEIGETLYAVGFPSRTIPLTASASIKQTHKCVYRGPTLMRSDYNEDKLTITNLINCDTIFSNGGMSGGAILNENSEVVGVLNAEISSGRLRNSDENRLYFTEITKKAFEINRDSNLIPAHTGRLSFDSFLIEKYKKNRKRVAGGGRMMGPKTRTVTYYTLGESYYMNSLLVDVNKGVPDGRFISQSGKNGKYYDEIIKDGVFENFKEISQEEFISIQDNSKPTKN